MAPSRAKQGLSSPGRDLVASSHSGGIRLKWQTHRGSVHPLRLQTLARKSWAMTDSDPDSPWYGWRVGLCERPGLFMEWQA